MQKILIFVLCFMIFYIMFKNRKFDFFTVAVFSALAYYFPCFIGCVKVSVYSSETITLSTGLYTCILLFLLVLFLFIIISDNCVIKSGDKLLFSCNYTVNRKLKNDDYTNLAVLCVAFLGLAMAVYTSAYYTSLGANLSKMQLLASANKVVEYSKYIALFTFVYFFICEGRFVGLGKCISSLLILYTFLLGHRSFAVIGIIAVMMHLLSGNKRVKLIDLIRKRWLFFLILLIVAFFFLFVKNVFAAFMSGQYDLVKSRLSNPDYYIDTLLTSESNTITRSIQYVTESDMRYSIGEYIFMWALIVPFLGNTIAATFSYVPFEEQLNVLFNADYSQGIGIGSTYLGEAYAVGGFIGVAVIMVLTYTFFLFVQQKKEKSDSVLVHTFAGILLVYLSFYIHRNSLGFLVNMARAYIYILILVLITKYFVKGLFRKA